MGKSKSYLISILKWLFSAIVLYMIYQQIFSAGNFDTLYKEFKHAISSRSLIYLLVPVLLVPVNVLIESEKYRLLINSQGTSYQLSSRTSINQILIGFMLSIVMPNGIGEFAGRMYEAESGTRSKSLIASSIGAISQWIVLIAGGLLASFYLFDKNDNVLGLSLHTTQLLTFIILLLLIVFYFNLKFSINLCQKLISKAFSKIESQRTKAIDLWLVKQNSVFESAGLISQKPLFISLILALLRYAVYTLQLSLTFYFFGFNASWPIIFAGIAFIFLIQVIMPLPTITISLARVELGLLIWSDYAPNELSLVVGSLVIFILNIVIPALVGMVVFSNLKITSNHEE